MPTFVKNLNRCYQGIHTEFLVDWRQRKKKDFRPNDRPLVVNYCCPMLVECGFENSALNFRIDKGDVH